MVNIGVVKYNFGRISHIIKYHDDALDVEIYETICKMVRSMVFALCANPYGRKQKTSRVSLIALHCEESAC